MEGKDKKGGGGGGIEEERRNGKKKRERGNGWGKELVKWKREGKCEGVKGTRNGEGCEIGM